MITMKIMDFRFKVLGQLDTMRYGYAMICLKLHDVNFVLLAKH